jgi:hypothetical protein
VAITVASIAKFIRVKDKENLAVFALELHLKTYVHTSFNIREGTPFDRSQQFGDSLIAFR